MKSRERAVPLWALMLATQWLDVIFVPLFVIGVEHLEPVAGTTGGYGNVIIHADYTHSLLGAAAIAALSGLVAASFWSQRTGAVLGAVVFSHWVLDLVVHRGDLSVLPGNVGGFSRLGFGLWKAPVASAGVELMLVLAGSLLYFWAARRMERKADGVPTRQAYMAGGLMLVSGIVTLVLNVLGYECRADDILGRLPGGASRRAAWLLPQMHAAFSVIAPCPPGAAVRKPCPKLSSARH